MVVSFVDQNVGALPSCHEVVSCWVGCRSCCEGVAARLALVWSEIPVFSGLVTLTSFARSGVTLENGRFPFSVVPWLEWSLATLAEIPVFPGLAALTSFSRSGVTLENGRFPFSVVHRLE